MVNEDFARLWDTTNTLDL